MAFGKITGSVIQDNTITESNLAFGISGQSAASSWATDTLKVNILESDDSTSVTVNDGLIVTGNLAFDGGVSVSTILDEDDMSSDSATALATQQSIKAYIDSQAGGSTSFTFVGDDSTGATVQTGDSIQFKGGTGVQVTVDDDSTKGFAVVNFTSTAAINLDGGNATTDYNLEAIVIDGGGA